MIVHISADVYFRTYLVELYVTSYVCVFFFVKHETSYEMRISDWSSDVCSSDLFASFNPGVCPHSQVQARTTGPVHLPAPLYWAGSPVFKASPSTAAVACTIGRSEEHTSELQSLMRISYAVFCLKKKNKHTIAHSLHIDTRGLTYHQLAVRSYAQR